MNNNYFQDNHDQHHDEKTIRDIIYEGFNKDLYTELELTEYFLKLEQYEKCIEKCNRILEKYDDNYHSYFTQGKAYMMNGDFENMIVSYSNVIDFAPNRAQAIKMIRSELSRFTPKLQEEFEQKIGIIDLD